MSLSEGTNTTATGLDANSACLYNRLVNITDNLAVYVYQDTTVSGDVYARVVTTSGTSIDTIGSEATVLAATWSNGQFHVARVSSSGFVVLGNDGTTTIGRITGVACTISGTTITPGSETVIEGTAGTVSSREDFNVCQVDDGKCVCVYQDQNATNDGTAVAFTVSGTTIGTPGSGHVFDTTAAYVWVDGFNLDGTNCIVSFTDSSNDVKAQVLQVSGTTVTSGTAVTLATTETQIETMCVGMSSTVAFVAYEQTTGIADTGYLHYVTRSGTTLTNVSSQGYGSTTNPDIMHGMTRMSDTVCLITYTDGDEKVREMYLNGTTLTIGDTLTVDTPAAGANLGIAIVDSGGNAVSIHNGTDIAVITSDLVSYSGYGLVQSAGGNARSSMAVSADGTAVFIALEDDTTGNQLVFNVTRPTSTTPTTAVAYNPLGGSAANVYPTGDLDKMVFSGSFGTDVGVIDHQIAAATNTDISPSSIGSDVIAPVQVDLSDPDHIVIVNKTDEDMIETTDNGSNWTTLQATLGVQVVAMAMAFFGQYFPFGGFVAGNDGTDEHLAYSPNKFANQREDTSAALKAVGAVTGVDVTVD